MSYDYDFDFNMLNMDAFSDESDQVFADDLPLLPLRDTVVFPGMMRSLAVGRDRSIKAVEAAMATDNRVVVVAQRDPEVQDPEMEDLYTVGVEMVVGRILRMPDGTTNVLGQGRRRVQITGLSQTGLKFGAHPMGQAGKKLMIVLPVALQH